MEAASDDMESRNSYSAIGNEKWLKKKKKKTLENSLEVS